MPHQVHPAHRGIHLELEFPAALIVQIHAEQSRDDEERHDRLDDHAGPAPRQDEIKDNSDDAQTEQRERNQLLRIFVVREERQFRDEPRHAEEQHSKHEATDDIDGRWAMVVGRWAMVRDRLPVEP